MKIGAIDIGSNAARMQISAILENEGTSAFKKVEYLRFPLQLGKDVFHIGSIGPQREANLTKFLQASRLLFELHDVKHYQICATSAMREAENSAEIVQRIEQKLGMRIQVISGNQEADLVNRVVVQELDEATYIHIDVGGGSTELNVYQNRQKIAARSFKIGSVRLLEEPKEAAKQWKKIKEWLKEQMQPVKGEVKAVGTGGNISKIYEMAGTYSFDPVITNAFIHQEAIAAVYDFVAKHTVAERINKLSLNPDRADVIIPAVEIYLFVMKCVNAVQMRVPEIGLIDGIILGLYKKWKK